MVSLKNKCMTSQWTLLFVFFFLSISYAAAAPPCPEVFSKASVPATEKLGIHEKTVEIDIGPIAAKKYGIPTRLEISEDGQPLRFFRVLKAGDDLGESNLASAAQMAPLAYYGKKGAFPPEVLTDLVVQSHRIDALCARPGDVLVLYRNDVTKEEMDQKRKDAETKGGRWVDFERAIFPLEVTGTARINLNPKALPYNTREGNILVESAEGKPIPVVQDPAKKAFQLEIKDILPESDAGTNCAYISRLMVNKSVSPKMKLFFYAQIAKQLRANNVKNIIIEVTDEGHKHLYQLGGYKELKVVNSDQYGGETIILMSTTVDDFVAWINRQVDLTTKH